MDFPPRAEGLRSTRAAGDSRAVSSIAPSAGEVEGRRVVPVPGQIMPLPVLPPGTLTPPGVGGRAGGLGGWTGRSLRIKLRCVAVLDDFSITGEPPNRDRAPVASRCAALP